MLDSPRAAKPPRWDWDLLFPLPMILSTALIMACVLFVAAEVETERWKTAVEPVFQKEEARTGTKVERTPENLAKILGTEPTAAAAKSPKYSNMADFAQGAGY